MSVQEEQKGAVERDLMLDKHVGHSHLSNMTGAGHLLGHRNLSKGSVQYHMLSSGKDLAMWDIFYRSPRGKITNY